MFAAAAERETCRTADVVGGTHLSEQPCARAAAVRVTLGRRQAVLRSRAAHTADSRALTVRSPAAPRVADDFLCRADVLNIMACDIAAPGPGADAPWLNARSREPPAFGFNPDAARFGLMRGFRPAG